MRKRLSYRRAKKGIAEQYSISINQDIVRSLGITESNRTIISIMIEQLKE